MVRQGAAWVYRQYVTDRSLFNAENEARIARLGIWSLPEAERMEPWEWRRQDGGAVPMSAPAAAIPASGASSCGNKRYCGEMSYCEEAQFYLRNCGLSRLDGDSDVPCEAICR